jgi:hypothetical protein
VVATKGTGCIGSLLRLDGLFEADTVTDSGHAGSAKAARKHVKNYMHPQHFGPVFRQFIPRFRRFGGSPMTLHAAFSTLSSLAAH